MLRNGAESLRILALAAALQAVEQDQVTRSSRAFAQQMIDINEVTIGRGPAFTREARRSAEVAL